MHSSASQCVAAQWSEAGFATKRDNARNEVKQVNVVKETCYGAERNARRPARFQVPARKSWPCQPPAGFAGLAAGFAFGLSTEFGSGRSRRPMPLVMTGSLRFSRSIARARSEEHTSELQSHVNLVC